MKTIFKGISCGCKKGIERDNCPNCEGTGKSIDFRAMREQKPVNRFDLILSKYPEFKPGNIFGSINRDEISLKKQGKEHERLFTVSYNEIGYLVVFTVSIGYESETMTTRLKDQNEVLEYLKFRI